MHSYVRMSLAYLIMHIVSPLILHGEFLTSFGTVTVFLSFMCVAGYA